MCKLSATEMFFFIAEFERAAKIRKNAVYHFLISLLVLSYKGLKVSSFRSKGAQRAVKINENQ